MPSSYSSSLRFELQFTGENTNTWGDRLNSAFSRADSSIAGFTIVALTGNYTLTSANGSADQARSAMLKFTGTGAFTVTIPSVSKSYLIWNACTGIVTITTGAGTTVSVDSGDIVAVICDAANVKPLGYGGLSIKDYIAAVAFASVGTLPAQLGNAGKYIRTDGTNATWQFVAASDITGLSASASVTRVGTSTAVALTPGDTYAAFAEVALTSTAGSVAIDFSTLINGYHLFTENTTFANPTNVKPGQTGYIRVQQHASAAKTGAFGANWKRAGGAIAFSTTLSGFDFIMFEAITSTYILYDLVKNPS